MTRPLLYPLITGMTLKHLSINNYDYNLPDDRIARYPLPDRSSSKLLVCRGGKISESLFHDLPNLLPPDSLLVYNDTRVIQARLLFHKDSGARIEIFLLEPHTPVDYAQSFIQTQSVEWICLIGNRKKWKTGSLTLHIEANGYYTVLKANYTNPNDEATSTGSPIIRLSWDNPAFTFADVLEAVGELPIPPYLNRPTEENDKHTYQTVYSNIQGSVAAPTAGLHFTPQLLAQLQTQGIQQSKITLHVGAGTFRPVKSETIGDHEMHHEVFSITRQAIQQLLDHQGTLIAVGTTTVRTLESLYYIGRTLHHNPSAPPDQLHITQWQPYEPHASSVESHSTSEPHAAILPSTSSISPAEALTAILCYLDTHKLTTLTTTTQILIAPGYHYHLVQGLITNFHQPKSTLLLLVSALIGDKWREVYTHALTHNFRFLSYGDSSLLLP